MRVLLLCLAVGAFLPPLGEAQPPTPESVLRVQGTAEVRAAPDLAVVRLGVNEQAPTAGEAQRAVNTVARAILDAVIDLGIEPQRIQTVRLVLSPIYAPRQPNTPQEPRIVGYRASNTVSIRVDDIDVVGQVVDAALQAGGNQLEGVSFALADDQPLRQEALGQAITRARGKAETMAAALGVSLGEVITVTEDNVQIQPPMMMMENARAFSLQAEAPTAVSPGEVSIRASVSIAYQLGRDRP
jgi:hypothetical protein